jgi:hypothetical protein
MQTEILLHDSQGHAVGCPQYGKESPSIANEHRGHLDLFCDCHSWTEPVILKNGTDIAWPAGWDAKLADEWRRRNDLAPPSEPGAGP